MENTTVEYNVTASPGIRSSLEDKSPGPNSTGLIIGVSFTCIIVGTVAVAIAIIFFRRRVKRAGLLSLIKDEDPESETPDSDRENPSHESSHEDLPNTTLTSSNNVHGYDTAIARECNEKDCVGSVLNKSPDSTQRHSGENSTYINTRQLLKGEENEDVTAMKQTASPEEDSVYCNTATHNVNQATSTTEIPSGNEKKLQTKYTNKDVCIATKLASSSGLEEMEDISENYQNYVNKEQENDIYVNNEISGFPENQCDFNINRQSQCDLYVEPDILVKVYENKNSLCEIYQNGNIEETRYLNESGNDEIDKFHVTDPNDDSDVYENCQNCSQSIDSVVKDNTIHCYENSKLECSKDSIYSTAAGISHSVESLEENSNDSVYSLAGNFGLAGKRTGLVQAHGSSLYSHLRDDVHKPVHVYDFAPV